MDPLHDRFDEVAPLRSGESEIESRRASFARIKARIAGKLRQAAGTLHGGAEDNQTPREASNFGSHAGDWLHNSANYIEGMEPKKIKDDITERAPRNPGKSLLVAAAAGLILGAIFRRK
ncbi:MAG TPA: hypothetical protein VFY40_22990 [Blastocatellia bacterium]|nr:hypothetical protein [Blastocatellia bacterium]